jgi:hypothetical protein
MAGAKNGKGILPAGRLESVLEVSHATSTLVEIVVLSMSAM